MIVFCVARQPGAISEETIAKLSAAMGLRNVDRDYVESKLGEFGFGAEKTRRFDEKKPSFLSALSRDRDEYLHYMKTILYAEALREPCMVVGRGGFSVFAGVPGAVSVLVVAPQRRRVRAIAEQYACGEKQAEHLLKKLESDREGFHRFFFNVEWLDPSNYDVCVNAGDLSPDRAVETIRGVAALCSDPAVDDACRGRIGELSLGCRVVDEISYVRRLPIHFADADVRNGVVTLRGVANTQSAVDSAVAAAHTVPGVKDVESVIQIVQDYTMLP
ncbi:MAG: cytidylate kinase family protein [Spirochaetes bacterium]|nr:cytidylate kinase family protein [Spirochaetota bacterium]